MIHCIDNQDVGIPHLLTSKLMRACLRLPEAEEGPDQDEMK